MIALFLSTVSRAGSRVDEQNLVHTARASTTREDTRPTAGILSPGESQTHQITLVPGQYVRLSVVPVELDVHVSVISPNGDELLRKISSYGLQGPVDLCFVAKLPGVHQVIVGATDNNARPGNYELRMDAPRKSTALDALRARAEAIVAEAQARQLGNEATADSRKSAIRRYEEALILLKESGDRLTEAQVLDSLGGLHNNLGNNKKAVELFKQSLLLFQKLNDRRGEAMARSDLGSVENDLGDNRQALVDLNQALLIRKQIGDQRGQAETLEYIGTLYENTSDSQRALKTYDEALLLRKKIGDLRGEAESLKDIGIVHYDIDEEQTALEYYSKALPVQHSLHDLWDEALTLNSIGAVYDSLGEKRKALEYFAQSLPLKAALGNRQGQAHTLGNMCSAERTLGEWQNAIDHCRAAIDISRGIGDRQWEAASLTKLGLIYIDLGEPERALKLFRRSLVLARATSWLQGEATNLNSIGQVLHDLKDDDNALANYNLALPIRHKGQDRSGEAATLCNMGRSYLAQEKKLLAFDYFNRALTVARAAGIRQWEANSLNNLGWLYTSSRQNDKALDNFSQALSVYQGIGDQKGVASVLYGTARAEKELGRLSTAFDHIESALSIVETLRTKIASQQLRTSYFSSVRDYYEFYIDLLMQMEKVDPSKGYAAKAFEESERSRARSLLETVQEAGVDFHSGVDTVLLERERSLQQLLEGKAQRQMRLVADQGKDKQVAAARKEVVELQVELQSVEAQIRAASPAYAALTQLKPVGSVEIQNQELDASTILLEYFLGDQNSYLWVITSDSVQSFCLPKRTEIEHAARRLIDLLTSRNRSEQGGINHGLNHRLKQVDSESLAASLALSQMVLGPVTKLIQGKRLLIIADGALQFVPFQALPEPGNEHAGWQDALVTTHEVVELPSASVLLVSRLGRTERKPATKQIAVLADPVFDQGDSRVTSGRQIPALPADTAARGRRQVSSHERLSEASRSTRSVWEVATRDGTTHLQRLLFSRQEAKSIFGMVPDGDALEALDFRASRATAMSPELSQYRIIHFATHGLLDSEHPELSGLVLSLVDEQGRPLNGFLDLQDIYNLNLPADLVVLSACESALGKEVKGEGLIGLTRGFMYAGADRVVASLWKVDDAATSELMEQFYRGMLQKGMRPSAALRQAEIEMLQQGRWANPYYWGAFTIQGEWK
jgi:CHAT domain-containing protein